jgi:hypothetical protein
MLRIDGYLIDCEVSSEPSRENVVAEYPVEAGEDHSDHAFKTPLKLEVQGAVSDTPVGATATERERFVLINGEAFARPSEEATAKLVALHESREPVLVESATGRFENMVLERLTMPRDRSTGQALRFSATFKQITFVTNERSSVRVDLPRAKGKKDLGFKQALQASLTSLAGSARTLASKFLNSRAPGSIVSSTLVQPPAPPEAVDSNAAKLAARRPVRSGGSQIIGPLPTGGSL